MFAKHNKPFYVADGVPGGQPSANPQPQAGDPPANPQVGNEPPKPARTPAEYEGEIAALRRESASHRTKLTAFEKAEADRQAATLSEQQKLEKRAADAEAQAKAYQMRITSYEVMMAAQKLSIVDPDVAAKLIADDLEFDDQGQPKNVDELLKKLIKDKPYLVAQPQQAPQNQQPQSRQPSMNPPRNRVAPQQNNQPFDYQNRPGLSSIWNKDNK